MKASAGKLRLISQRLGITSRFKYGMTLMAVAGMLLAVGVAGPTRAKAQAVGGDKVEEIDVDGVPYRVHVFTNAVVEHEFEVLVNDLEVEYLIVGGGGGGGQDRGGGGGAGGVIAGISNLNAQIYPVEVGPGGVGGIGSTDGEADATNGGDSSAFGQTAIGGGRGGYFGLAAGDGGSGGGAGGSSSEQPSGSGTPDQGYDGGERDGNRGGGGGGYSEAGSDAGSGGGGRGGDGFSYDITGLALWYAGGGGGGTREQEGGVGGGGGLGGGGKGGDPFERGADGDANTGGGGGGGGSNPDRRENGGDGGSGIVIIRYVVLPHDEPVILNQPVTDITGDSATFNGMLMSTGSSATAVCVLWGATDGGSEWGTWANTNWFNDGNPNPAWTNWTPFSTNIALDSGTDYYYTFGASNDTTNFVAPSTISFFTPTLPVVTNLGVVARRTAQLKGQVLNTGGETPTCWFAWWEDGLATTNTVPMGPQSDVFSTELTELDGETTYGFVVVASNSAGVATSDTQSFTTLTSDPINWYAATNGTGGAWTNWATAGTNLQAILDVAESGDNVYLAGHTFDLTNALSWASQTNVIMRGGYQGVSGTPGDHDPALWPTVLRRDAAHGNFRVMRMIDLEDCRLEHVTVANGDVRPRGGGMEIQNSSVVIADCIISNNRSWASENNDAWGGGIYVQNSSVTISNSVFTGNKTFVSSVTKNGMPIGGALCAIGASSSLVVVDCTFIDNEADSQNIYGDGSQGGAIYMNVGDGLIRNTRIIGNRVGESQSTGRGGGIFMCGGTMVENSVIVSNRTFGNSSWGGGFYMDGGGELRNCLVARNSATGSGSGGGGAATGGLIESTTVANNSSVNIGTVAGVYLSGSATVTNAIFYANYRQNDEQDASISDAGGMVTYSCIVPLRSGVGNIGADPAFADASDGDYRLQHGSPAIDAGLNQDWMLEATDLAGLPRILNGVVDMGCYETIPPRGTLFLVK